MHVTYDACSIWNIARCFLAVYLRWSYLYETKCSIYVFSRRVIITYTVQDGGEWNS
jgi:hypothetical protein